MRGQPGDRGRAGPRGRKRNGKVINQNPNSYYVLNDDPALKGSDITNPQQGFDEGAGGSGQPNVTFGFTGKGKGIFEKITQRNRPPRPGSAAAGGHEERGPAALRGRARRAADHGPLDRLHPVPRRDRRLHRLADLRRLHDQHGAGLANELPVRRPAAAAEADLALPGLGDARQNRPRTGAGGGPRRLRRGVHLPARLLPRARPDRGRRAVHLRHLLLRADQADPDHADAAGDRRPDPHDRRLRGRQHRDLRARQGGDTQRADRSSRASRRATNAASRRSSTPTS